MIDIAKVNLYGQHIGSVRWDSRRNYALFEYADNFVDKGLEPSPILMPVRYRRVYSFGDIGRDTFKGLPGMLADSFVLFFETYCRDLGYEVVRMDTQVKNTRPFNLYPKLGYRLATIKTVPFQGLPEKVKLAMFEKRL